MDKMEIVAYAHHILSFIKHILLIFWKKCIQCIKFYISILHNIQITIRILRLNLCSDYTSLLEMYF